MELINEETESIIQVSLLKRVEMRDPGFKLYHDICCQFIVNLHRPLKASFYTVTGEKKM